MTPEQSPARSEEFDRWVKKYLGLEENLSPAAARTFLLGSLPEMEFVPPLAWQQAGELCAGRAPTAAAELQLEYEQELRTELEAFAAQFFAIPWDTREARWRELFARSAAYPALLARLQALQPGLAIEPKQFASENPRALQLATHVAELFVLRPAERCTRRLKLIETWIDRKS